MRFVSAQLVTLLGDDLWLRSARHANTMAGRLRDAVVPLDGVVVTRPVQANAVFAVVAGGVAERSTRRDHSGTFPCLRFGSSSRFETSMARLLISTLRVSEGSITSSM